MPDIKKLSTSLINKIAAGEVIERPGSVVKELVENSIDAGAKRIEIIIQRAGNELICVTDNGCGIPSDQLELALSPHATSKIAETEDLFAVRSFGFRGEALASIAEVSQLVLRTAVAGAAGAEIRAEGGRFDGPNPIGTGVGTSIEVRNLFFNTPVRRKFLKGPVTEFGHISEAVIRLAIPNIGIHFILKHNGRTIYDLPPSDKIEERVARIFGPDFAARLIPIDSSAENLRIWGFVGHPDLSRSNNSCQYFFLNRRYFRDRSLQHALTQAYRGLLTVGRYPVAFLELDLSPELVDVNVHPTKMEVRFLDANRIYSGILSGIRNEFLRGDMKSRPQAADGGAETTWGKDDQLERDLPPETPQNGLDDERTEAVRSDILDWTRHITDPATAEPASKPRADSDCKTTAPKSTEGEGDLSLFSPSSEQESRRERFRPVGVPNSRPASTVPAETFRRVGGPVPTFRPFSDGSGMSSSPQNGQKVAYNIDRVPNGNEDDPSPEPESKSTSAFNRVAHAPDGRPVIQVQDRYLVLETEEGMAIIDQHALHERILYEKLKRTFKESGRLESQRLLVPETLDLSPTEAACALENQKTFGDFGLLIESFGGNTILISGYPPLLGSVPPSETVTDLLGLLLKRGREGVEMEDLLDEMIRQSACKAAVKGGDRLRGDAMTELLALAQREIYSHHCPHGRPSILVFGVPELDKMFKRT